MLRHGCIASSRLILVFRHLLRAVSVRQRCIAVLTSRIIAVRRFPSAPGVILRAAPGVNGFHCAFRARVNVLRNGLYIIIVVIVFKLRILNPRIIQIKHEERDDNTNSEADNAAQKDTDYTDVRIISHCANQQNQNLAECPCAGCDHPGILNRKSSNQIDHRSCRNNCNRPDHHPVILNNSIKKKLQAAYDLIGI